MTRRNVITAALGASIAHAAMKHNTIRQSELKSIFDALHEVSLRGYAISRRLQAGASVEDGRYEVTRTTPRGDPPEPGRPSWGSVEVFGAELVDSLALSGPEDQVLLMAGPDD